MICAWLISNPSLVFVSQLSQMKILYNSFAYVVFDYFLCGWK
jgi:hypothetical protein